jgi:hypothetical protein
VAGRYGGANGRLPRRKKRQRAMDEYFCKIFKSKIISVNILIKKIVHRPWDG